MNASDIKQNLRRTGFVFTDLDNGVRVQARGPQSPSTEAHAGERDTIVKATKDGEPLESTACTNHGVAATRYTQMVDKYREMKK